LGISEAGVRKRVQRGQIPYERDETGRLWVYLDASVTEGRKSRDRDGRSRESSASTLLLDELRAHNRTLAEQLEAERRSNGENRRIIAALTQRIPAIEAPVETPQGPPEASTAATEQPGRIEPPASVEGPQEGTERVPWWRMFGT